MISTGSDLLHLLHLLQNLGGFYTPHPPPPSYIGGG